jgi:hypothetical protein
MRARRLVSGLAANSQIFCFGDPLTYGISASINF